MRRRERERVALLDTLSEYDMFRDGSDLWLWDSTHQTARHGSVDALTEALLAFASPAELAKTFTGPAAIKTAVFDTATHAADDAGRGAGLLRPADHAEHAGHDGRVGAGRGGRGDRDAAERDGVSDRVFEALRSRPSSSR